MSDSDYDSDGEKKPAIKKGPGRPRKNPKKEPGKRNGISLHPQDADNYIEVLYDCPIIFKKIFQFFKALAATHIQILFRPTDIIFYAIDHHKASKIRIRVIAAKLNHYYCRNVLDVGISAKDVELILNKIDKTYSNIVIMSHVNATQRSLIINLHNDMKIEESHTCDLIGQYDKIENEAAFSEAHYAIKFEFPSKNFRKMITEIKAMSDQLSIIQDDARSPLSFEYLTANKKIQSRHIVKEKDRIKLISQVNDDGFRVDIVVDHINPISKAQISENIKLCVDENKPLMTISYVDDNAIEIITLTNIIDSR